MSEFLLLLLSTALVNNVVLIKFLGLCPVMGVSKSVDSALGMGLATALLLLLASAPALDTALTDFFAQASVPDAFGRNVVNVILVDFRALDTLGEVTVVMLSFLAAWGLLAAARREPKGDA